MSSLALIWKVVTISWNFQSFAVRYATSRSLGLPTIAF